MIVVLATLTAARGAAQERYPQTAAPAPDFSATMALPPSTAVPSAPASNFVPSPVISPSAYSAADLSAPAVPVTAGDFVTREELQADLKKAQWSKGDFKIVPYGILWATTAYESQRTVTGDYVFYVAPARPNEHEAYHLDARSTRFGLDITGPPIPLFCEATNGGKIEFDFQRQIDTENKASVLLRHAYLEIKSPEYRLLAGQTWDVISPLNPGMLMYSIGWGGGNIGYRRAQFRGERYWAFSDALLLTAQGSINTDIITDSATGLSGDHVAWPISEGRLALTVGQRGPDCFPVELGVWSHVGEQSFDFSAPYPNPVLGLVRRTWSLGADFRLPFNEFMGVQGEVFTGENLGAFQGGVLQGIDEGTAARPGSRGGIRSSGGWVDLWYDFMPQLHSHYGYGLDDPFDNDVTVGRLFNTFLFANLSYDLTKKFLVGIEFTSWQTLWANLAPVTTQRIEFAAKYSF